LLDIGVAVAIIARLPIHLVGHDSMKIRVAIWLCLLGVCLWLGGCYSDMTTARPLGRPPKRTGSMPFPGMYTLFHEADPFNLGAHSYEGAGNFGINHEVGRGTLYTCREGFLDIAHVRMTIDLVRHAAYHVAKALHAGQTSITLQGMPPSILHLSFQYPSDWDSISPEDKDKLIAEASIRIGQRLAILQATWHEIITWYGYASFLVSEKTSAFSYDDMCSHMVGAYVASYALHDTTRDYDAAVTYYLNRELDMLGRATVDQCRQAIKAVRGKWWYPGIGRERKRDLCNVFADKTITPWLVPGMDFCTNDKPYLYTLPTLKNVNGRDLRDLCHVEIQPNTVAWKRMQIAVGLPGQTVDPDRDFPAIFVELRKEMHAEFGDGFDDPHFEAGK
jgi:Protein of unknown function (DUF4056)